MQYKPPLTMLSMSARQARVFRLVIMHSDPRVRKSLPRFLSYPEVVNSEFNIKCKRCVCVVGGGGGGGSGGERERGTGWGQTDRQR